MINRNNKKGFTIVELVIVIAVIAILAAVLIPTFAGIIRKANLSADMQAVRQMNSALMADGVSTPTDILNLHEVLAEQGMTSEDYHPLTNDTYFFWDAELNRVLHVDKNLQVIAPEEYAGQAYSSAKKWYTLSLEIMEEKVKIDNNGAVTVKSGAQMQYVLNEIKDGKKEVAITVDGTVDMMGAAFNLPTFDENAGYKITISGSGTIKNVTAMDYAEAALSSEDGQDGVYDCALIPTVKAGNTVTISGVTFDNLIVKNTATSGVGLLIGGLKGTANISDVTITNSTVIGHRNVGALVGTVNDYGKAIISGNITLNNVDVMTVGGRSGMLVGIQDTSAKVDATGATIVLDKECSYGIYECERNKGVFEGKDLGLKDGKIYSYAPDEGVETWMDYPYAEDALVMSRDANGNFVADTTIFAGKVQWN